MALQHLRSNTASKRPTAGAMSDGQIAVNTNATSPGLFFKDAGGAIIKVGPVHVGTTAPNSSPAGSTGNSLGEQWLDTSGGGYVLKIWDGSAWRSEVGEFVDAAGDTMTGDLIMNNANIVFEGSTDDGFETTLTVVDPTADRTITLPNVTGTVVTTGDTGTVTSTMIADGTIVNADINASAAIAPSKIGSGALPSGVTVASANIVNGTIVNADVNASAAIAGTKIDPDFGSQTIETTGLFSAAGGSAAAPSITFTGDTNTGIYSPGADQVAISTNGTGRLFVDASGNIGVGTSSPSGKLDVQGTVNFRRSSSVFSQIDGNSAVDLIYTANASRANVTPAHIFRSSTSGGAITERMRIDSSGRVGIGSSSPQTLLNLRAASGNAILRLENSNTAVGAGEALGAVEWYSNDASAGGTAVAGKINVVDENGFGTAYGMGFYTGQVSGGSYALAERVRIDLAGNVGIGTTSPTRLLTVQSTGNANFCIKSSNTGVSQCMFGDTDSDVAGNIAYRHSDNAMTFEVNSSERARIDSSGRLGIGTSSPSSRLHVSGGQADIRLTDTNVTNATWRLLAQIGNTTKLFRIFDDSNSADRLVIDSSGRVGIGTTSPSSLLHTSAGSDNELQIQSTGSGGAGNTRLRLRSATSTTTYDYYLQGDASGDFRLYDAKNATDRLRIDSSGRLLVGTVSGSYQLQLSTDSAGKPSTNTWTIVSDERIKEEIELADLDLCYEAVKNIPLKRFKWKDEVYTEEQAYDRRKLGWIAQDVEAVFPKAVRQHEFKYNQVFEEVVIPAVPAELDDDGNIITEEQPERIEKGELISEEVIEDCRDLNSDQLYAAMYGAIQKLISKVELLEAEVQALKAA